MCYYLVADGDMVLLVFLIMIKPCKTKKGVLQMKRKLSIVMSCVLLMLMLMPVSVAYAQDDGSAAVVEEEPLPLATDPMEEEIVPETCHPQVDNV